MPDLAGGARIGDLGRGALLVEGSGNDGGPVRALGGPHFNAARRSIASLAPQVHSPLATSASKPPTDLPVEPCSFSRQISGLIVHTQYETRTGDPSSITSDSKGCDHRREELRRSARVRESGDWSTVGAEEFRRTIISAALIGFFNNHVVLRTWSTDHRPSSSISSASMRC